MRIHLAALVPLHELFLLGVCGLLVLRGLVTMVWTWMNRDKRKPPWFALNDPELGALNFGLLK